MKLELHRSQPGTQATLGLLIIDEVPECITLEDVVRLDNPTTPEDEGKKVYGETAIPAGTYKVTVELSPKFGKMYPRLHGVPNFTGILIHSGNTSHDTLGCIIVGSVIDDADHIHGGSVVFPKLLAKLEAAQARGEEITITVTNDFLEPK